MTSFLYSEIKRQQVPPIYAGEFIEDPIVYLELGLLGLEWRWFVTECQIEEDDILFYGYVQGDYSEWGYFRLSELGSQTLPFFVIPDFQPKPFSKLKKELHEV